jgi:death on curing protein
MEFVIPVYENVLRIHELALKLGGGLAGILHEDRIHAAIARPQSYIQYDDNCDIHLICAILLHALATGHGFTEGNKRTALLTMLVTYNVNNVPLQFSYIMNDEYKDLVLWVVKDKPDVKEIAPKLKELADKNAPGPLDNVFRLLRGGI